MQSLSDRSLLAELLASAVTPEDFSTVAKLADEIEAKSKPTGRYVVPTLRDVAAFFGVAEQTVRQWGMRPGGLPGEPGKWPLDEIAKWLTRWRDAPDVPREPTTLEKVKERLAELDLAEREKRLVDVAELSIAIGRMAAIIRDGITALEQRHGTEAADVMRTPLDRLKQEVKALEQQ